MTWQSKFGYTVLIMLIWLSVATAARVVMEDGDAGSLPDEAQIVNEEVDLSDGILEIHGSITPGNDEDMYRIEISIPMLFSANTNLPGVFIEDTRLFLFDVNGNGVCANHDNPNALPGDPNASLAVIPQGTCEISFNTLIPPGTYFIAISTVERYPVFTAGDPSSHIFPDTPRDLVVRPFVNAGPIAGWEGTGQRGDLYIIQLTGVNYPDPKCEFVGKTDDDNSNATTLHYLATDPNLNIASVDVTRLNLLVDSDLVPEVRIPLDPADPDNPDTLAVLGQGDSLSIDPPRDTVAIDVYNPNRFADLESEIRVTNTVGGGWLLQFLGKP